MTRQLSRALNVTEENLLAFQQAFKKFAAAERARLQREKTVLQSMSAMSNLEPLLSTSQVKLASAAERELDILLGEV